MKLISPMVRGQTVYCAQLAHGGGRPPQLKILHKLPIVHTDLK